MKRILPITLTTVLLVVSAGLAQDRPSGGQPDVPRFTDARQPIVLSDVERAFIRREMRGFLDSLREILDAAAAGDCARVIAAAERSGMHGPEADHIPKSLAPKLPIEFKQLGLATHRGFDQIAHEAEQSGTAAAAQRVGALMGNCVACHTTWRVSSAGER
jgi:mono/diheme cytochrome c family protein